MWSNTLASNEPFVAVRRSGPQGNSYVILWKDKYWHANQWEHDCIMKEGITPEDLGMYPHDSDDYDNSD